MKVKLISHSQAPTIVGSPSEQLDGDNSLLGFIHVVSLSLL